MSANPSPLLTAPIAPTLARLATLGIALAMYQIAVLVADTHFIGRLGTDPLAGLGLVFPMLMLLQMPSADAMGGGVSGSNGLSSRHPQTAQLPWQPAIANRRFGKTPIVNRMIVLVPAR